VKFRYEQERGVKLELLGILAVQYLSYCYDLELRFAKLNKAYTLSEQNIALSLSLLHSAYQNFLIIVGEMYTQFLKTPFNNVRNLWIMNRDG